MRAGSGSALHTARSAALEEADGPPSLTSHEEALLVELESKLAVQPEPPILQNEREVRRTRLVRWLRLTGFNVDLTFQKLHQHCKWWEDYGMDDFTEMDELDEKASLFVCGKDRWQRPVLVARPCAHLPANRQESMQSARRCVYTFQRCVERMPTGVEKATVIYDARELQASNLDLTFSREIVRAIESHFPGRLTRILVINNHWTMAFFWHAISVLLDPVTRSRIIFCGTDFRDSLMQFVEEDHEYLQYVLTVQGLPSRESATVPFPKSSPFVPRWQEALAHNNCCRSVEDDEGDISSETSRVCLFSSDDDLSEQSTAVSTPKASSVGKSCSDNRVSMIVSL